MSLKQTVAVIDYGMGNLHSVAKALEAVDSNANVLVTSDSHVITQADRVVFPGVGAIRDCMAELQRLELDHVVKQVVASKKPMLAICVGMQALMDTSEENGGVDCLGLLPGSVDYFGQNLTDETGERLKVPHMGWNQVAQSPHPLWDNIENNSRFYFVHSYFIRCTDKSLIQGACHYGHDFAAALGKDSLFAVQFHPEKSHKVGLQLLRNFMQWQPTS